MWELIVEASLEVVHPDSRNPALKSLSNSVQMFLVYSLCLGWPLINKLAPHAHQLLPLRDGDNDVLLCGYQRQTQQTASEQSWILSWEGEQWVGSDPALRQKVPISPYSIYCGWFLSSGEISSCLFISSRLPSASIMVLHLQPYTQASAGKKVFSNPHWRAADPEGGLPSSSARLRSHLPECSSGLPGT